MRSAKTDDIAEVTGIVSWGSLSATKRLKSTADQINNSAGMK